MKRIKSFFITTLIGGVVVLLPISILVFLIRFLIGIVSANLRPISRMLRGNSQMNQDILDFIALVIVIMFCFAIGLFVRTQFGKTSFTYFEENFLKKIPFYATIREIVAQFSNNKKTPFKQVVMVDAFGNGTRMTGFVTDEHSDGMYTVFVPTAPNPTNGYVFHVHKEQLVFLNTDMQEAMRSIIGMGAGSNLIKIQKEETSPEKESNSEQEQ